MYKGPVVACDGYLTCHVCRKLETVKKKQQRMQEQLYKLEVQATDKVPPPVYTVYAM